jgi:hypothetical protein
MSVRLLDVAGCSWMTPTEEGNRVCVGLGNETGGVDER